MRLLTRITVMAVAVMLVAAFAASANTDAGEVHYDSPLFFQIMDAEAQSSPVALEGLDATFALPDSFTGAERSVSATINHYLNWNAASQRERNRKPSGHPLKYPPSG